MSSYQMYQEQLGTLPGWLIDKLKEGAFNDEHGNVDDDLLSRVTVGCLVSKYVAAPSEVIDEAMEDKKVARLATLTIRYALEAVDI